MRKEVTSYNDAQNNSYHFDLRINDNHNNFSSILFDKYSIIFRLIKDSRRNIYRYAIILVKIDIKLKNILKSWGIEINWLNSLMFQNYVQFPYHGPILQGLKVYKCHNHLVRFHLRIKQQVWECSGCHLKFIKTFIMKTNSLHYKMKTEIEKLIKLCIRPLIYIL